MVYRLNRFTSDLTLRTPLGTSKVTEAVAVNSFEWNNSTLPGNISVATTGTGTINYDIDLTIDSTLGTFSGNLTLDFTTTSTLGGLVLHSKGLAVTRAALVVSPTSTLEAKTITYNTNYEYVLFTYASTVPKGSLTLIISWTGTVSNGTEGLYRSQYVDDSGNTQYMLATQFEPNYARRVFPCFDEPYYRAYYTLTINAPSTLKMGLSNSPYSNDPITTGSTITHDFAKSSAAIPPYLVAFALGDFTCISSSWGTIGSVARACFVTTDVAARTDLSNFALTATTGFMTWFENTARKSYAWPKLDILAIPDFSAGAMENPGLITFRETAMFVDAAPTPSFSSALRVVEVVAHEVAHQWYGNYLAPATWNDLWVAEGSATYWSYQAVEALYPGYGITNLFFLNNEWIPAMQADELSTTSSVKANVTTPAGARAIFDVTTYSKGASVLRQIANRMGSAAQMTSTMGNWFYQTSSSSMTSEQYLALFTTNNAGSDATPLITRAGAPIVNFSIPSNVTTTLTATLQSYSAFYSGQVTEDKTANWTISVAGYNSAGSGSSINIGTLSSTSRSLSASSLPTANWYKFNVNGMGYYRTQYPVSNWNLLSTAIKNNDTKLSTQDKVVLLSDAFTFAEIGQLDYSIALNMAVNALNVSQQRNYPVWKAAIDELSAINDILQDQSCAGNFHTMLGALLTPAYEYWTWNTTSVNSNSSSWTDSFATVNKRDAEELEATLDVEATSNPNGLYVTVTPNANDVLLRNLILSFGNDFITSASFKASATVAVNEYLADPVAYPLPVDTAAALLKTAVSTGTFTLWNRVWSRYLVATNVYEKSRLLSALASTDLPYMANLLLTRMISTDGTIRSQDHASILATISANEHTGPAIIWDFFRLNFATIYARFPQTIGSWVAPLTSFTQATRASDITSFFTANPSLGVDYASVVETINDNAIWISEYSSAICSYVTANYPGSKRDYASAA